MKIPFNIPYYSGTEFDNMTAIMQKAHYSGDGYFTKLCHDKIQNFTQCNKALLTTSCTHALEMAAILINVKEGDEIIMPSYTFVSTANAFVLRGAKIVFVDVHVDTMNINETLIEDLITSKTKAIVPVHYGGIPCNMDVIMTIAEKYDLYVIEDAAQALGSFYNGKALGTIGHLGCLSFHETKNIHCGEGGCLLINKVELIERAEIIREKGTNRSKFFRGEVDKYSWVDIGSSYLPSEINAAFLSSQLDDVLKVTQKRLIKYSNYRLLLGQLSDDKTIEFSPDNIGNGHIFFIKCKDIDERQKLINYLNEADIKALFHYIPLNSTDFGKKNSVSNSGTNQTFIESERLLRLPMYYELSFEQQNRICNEIIKFYKK